MINALIFLSLMFVLYTHNKRISIIETDLEEKRVKKALNQYKEFIK